MKRIYNAFWYSIDGILFAWSKEAAFRQVVLLALFGFLYAFFVIESRVYSLFLCFSSFLCMIIELLNTGIEKAVDHTSLEQHPLAKAAKDVGSAAQLLGLILFALTFLFSYNQ